jgi:alpha-mannosidase
VPSRPRLHVVALAHLDTQWRWTVRDTVRRHLPSTVEANERLFQRYPRYVLSFEGAYRYRLLEEHHPALFERVRRRVADGRWSPAGAAVEAFDTLLPAPESIVRQIVLGRRWFRARLGVDSRDLFLPDCFGFPATLPTLAVHCGLAGFSTQKLRRGARMRSAHGIPFAYGRWRGPDGSELLAALDPGEYSGRIEGDATRDPEWLARFAALERDGLPARLLFYVGTGDRGGAPPAPTVAALERALGASGPIEVRHGRSEAIFVETAGEERQRLPVYEGELLLRVHGTGCWAAKAILKRWNRRCERLACAAEAAAALARSAGLSAPGARIESAWWRLLAHQMHDDLTGTSIPAAYRFTLDALGLAANELAESLLDAVARAAARLDRTGAGTPYALFSPLAAPRAALAELELGPGEFPVRAIDADGRPLGCQIVERAGRRAALVPVRCGGVELQAVNLVGAGERSRAEPPAGEESIERSASTLVATADRLESERYLARFDAAGRLARLFDKRLGRELLAGPVELELLSDRSRSYPAWEIRWDDLAAPPAERADRLLAREVVERGPLRAALRVEQRARGCSVAATWSLAAGEAGEALELDLAIDWRRRGRLLELRFPLAASNRHALFDTGLGAVARPVSSERLYEAPAHGWAAIEDESGAFGVAVLADAPRGWNRPDAATLRATLLHAPRAGVKFRHQATHDFGRHRFRFALLGCAEGAAARGEPAHAADRFQFPPLAYRLARGGTTGAARRLVALSVEPPARALALLPLPGESGLQLRLSNPAATATAPRLALASAGAIARETDPLGEPADGSGEPLRPIAPSGLRTLELRSASAPAAPDPGFRALRLPLARDGFGAQGESARAGFDRAGRRFPRELAPRALDDAPVPFDLAHAGAGPADTAVGDGATIELPPGFAQLWLLGASIAGDRTARAGLDGRTVDLFFPDWRAALLVESGPSGPLRLGPIRRGEFRRRAVVWSAGHLHDRRGRDLPVERASLFALGIDLDGAARFRLPLDSAVRIVAATLARAPVGGAREAFAWPEP